MEVRIIHGDALQVRGFSGLVIPANRQLTLGWGSHLAEKVKKSGGVGIEEEALSKWPGGISCGEAVITGAGRLEGYTHIIHAAVLDKYDMNPLFLLRLKMRTTPECLTSAVRSSLEAASKAGLKGVVFTPMGAGTGGMPDRICASLTLKEIVEYSAGGRETSVDAVAVACYEKKTAEIFENTLRQIQEAQSR